MRWNRIKLFAFRQVTYIIYLAYICHLFAIYLPSTIYLQYIYHISAIYMPYVCNTEMEQNITICLLRSHKLYICHISVTYLLYICHLCNIYLPSGQIFNMSALSAIYLPYICHISAIYLPYGCHISVIYLRHRERIE